MYIVDLRNRLGQKQKFGLPTQMTMELLSIGSYNTYNQAYKDLLQRGFIKEIRKSKNQYSARVVAMSKIDKATNKALDKATIKATDETTDIIDKQLTTNNITRPDGISVTKKFVKPTLEQVQEYCAERSNTIDPESFLSHYDAVGWVYGKNKDKDVITKITNDNTVINAITNISDNVNVNDNDNVNDIEINYNTEILDLVEKFTSIKENAYNETQATIKKIGRKKYVDNQYNTIEKLIRAGHTLEQIEDVAIFCTKDEFRKGNVKSLCKLDQANKEGVKYINVLLDKIK